MFCSVEACFGPSNFRGRLAAYSRWCGNDVVDDALAA